MTIPELTLTGPPRQRGQAHGETCRDLIESAIEAWFQHLAPRRDPDDLVIELTHVSGLREAVERHAPDLFQEVWGISEGAAQSLEVMFAWQLIDEVWWYLDEVEGTLRLAERCSAMAVNHDGRGLVAQTQDLPRYFDGHQVILRYVEEDGMEVLVPSAAGLLAFNGVNSAGLAACITTLSQLAHNRQGVSSGFLMPMLLRCWSIGEAVELLERTPIASGNSFTLGTRDRSVVVEASADGVVTAFDGERAIHTNHALARQPTWEYSGLEGSSARLAHLDATVRPETTLADVKALYAQPPVCIGVDSESAFVNIGTMVFELGDTQTCHYAPGSLTATELVTYEMSP